LNSVCKNEKRCSSPTCTEHCHLGHQPSVDQLICSARTLQLASHSTVHQIQHRLHYLQDHPHHSACLSEPIYKMCTHVLANDAGAAVLSGLWTDLVIEQVLMRSLKSREGLSHGRGLTKSVCLTWIHTMHSRADIHGAMTQVTQLKHTSATQHKEMGATTAKRDVTDLSKIQAWFDEKDPFSIADGRLCCLSTGLTAEEGDGINCDVAEEVGDCIQKGMDGVVFVDVGLKKSNCVKTLQLLNKGVTIDSKTMFLHNTHLFSRLVVLVERTTDMAPYFCYEMTPLPAALFKHSQMRKLNKAALGQTVTKNAVVPFASCRTVHVLDGGSLLHRVKWPRSGTYGDILSLYTSYVQKYYGSSAVVVFDGYSSGPSAKDHEHERRAVKMAATVQVQESHSVVSSQ